MSQSPDQAKLSWRFPATFWVANVAELFERAAFYGMFIALTLYLTNEVGFADKPCGWVIGWFSFFFYLLPAFVGPLADKFGFRRSLIFAFVSLTIGYALLGAFAWKSTAIIALAIIAFGGAIVKPVIAGTASKCSDALNRARAFSIFYMMVNIGSFSGKTIAPFLRQGCDVPFVGHVAFGLRYINFYASAMAFCAVVLIAVAYRNPDAHGTTKQFSDVCDDFVRALCNGRFMCLILIVAGFWVIQGQLYASMPKYLIRLQGDGAKPEWLANVNPLVVVCCVAAITQLVRTMRSENSIMISMAIIMFSPLVMAASPLAERLMGHSVTIFGTSMYTITLLVVLGIALQGLAECFLSPKFLEYCSRLARPGEEGLYLGFQNLPTSVAWLVGSIMSGYLLDAFCPDPNKLLAHDPAQYVQWQAAITGNGPMPPAFANANYIWYVFAGIGLLSLLALLVFRSVTSRMDRRQLAN
jgi:dipeptide/tripeptide permease